jgi:hypothetical protein
MSNTPPRTLSTWGNPHGVAFETLDQGDEQARIGSYLVYHNSSILCASESDFEEDVPITLEHVGAGSKPSSDKISPEEVVPSVDDQLSKRKRSATPERAPKRSKTLDEVEGGAKDEGDAVCKGGESPSFWA